MVGAVFGARLAGSLPGSFALANGCLGRTKRDTKHWIWSPLEKEEDFWVRSLKAHVIFPIWGYNKTPEGKWVCANGYNGTALFRCDLGDAWLQFHMGSSIPEVQKYIFNPFDLASVAKIFTFKNPTSAPRVKKEERPSEWIWDWDETQSIKAHGLNRTPFLFQTA